MRTTYDPWIGLQSIGVIHCLEPLPQPINHWWDQGLLSRLCEIDPQIWLLMINDGPS